MKKIVTSWHQYPKYINTTPSKTKIEKKKNMRRKKRENVL